MRTITGTVVSDKMKKTVVVAVTFMKAHPKYRKTYKVTRKFKAHDENNEYHTGDTVVIEATRPLSREKRWKVIKKLTTNNKQLITDSNTKAFPVISDESSVIS